MCICSKCIQKDTEMEMIRSRFYEEKKALISKAELMSLITQKTRSAKIKDFGTGEYSGLQPVIRVVDLKMILEGE